MGVVLKHLEINGAGTGIDGVRFIAGSSLLIDNTRIMRFTEQGIEVTVPIPPATGAGRKLHVKDTTISDTTGGGIVLEGIVEAVLDNVRIERTGANGLRVNNNAEATVRNSVLSGNAQNGITAVPADVANPAVVDVEGSLLSANGTGGLRASGAGALARIGNSSVTENATGLTPAGGGIIESYGDNRVSGNGANGSPSVTTPRM